MSYHGLFSNGTKYRKKKLFLLWTTVCDLNILLACTTATAHTFAFEFDLVMDVMAIFSNTQTEESTGEKTYYMRVYKV